MHSAAASAAMDDRDESSCVEVVEHTGVAAAAAPYAEGNSNHTDTMAMEASASQRRAKRHRMEEAADVDTRSQPAAASSLAASHFNPSIHSGQAEASSSAASSSSAARWSTLYSDALNSCFPFLQLRDLHSTLAVCRHWTKCIRTCRTLGVTASAVFAEKDTPAALRFHESETAEHHPPRAKPTSGSALIRHVTTLDVDTRSYTEEIRAHITALPAVTHLKAIAVKHNKFAFDLTPHLQVLDVRAPIGLEHLLLAGAEQALFDQIGSLPQLHTIALHDMLATRPSLAPLLRLSHLTSLSFTGKLAMSCDFPGNLPILWKAENSAVIMQLAPRLQTLALPFHLRNIGFTRVEWPVLRKLAAESSIIETIIPGAPSLTSVRVMDRDVTLTNLAQLPSLRELRSFALHDELKSRGDAELLELLSQCTGLTSVDLRGFIEWRRLCRALPDLERISVDAPYLPNICGHADQLRVLEVTLSSDRDGMESTVLRATRINRYILNPQSTQELPPKAPPPEQEDRAIKKLGSSIARMSEQLHTIVLRTGTASMPSEESVLTLLPHLEHRPNFIRVLLQTRGEGATVTASYTLNAMRAIRDRVPQADLASSVADLAT